MNRGIAKRINRLTQKVKKISEEIKLKEDKKDTEELNDSNNSGSQNNIKSD